VLLSTWDTIKNTYVFDYMTFTFYGAIFQLLHLTYCIFVFLLSHNPLSKNRVWTNPVSLAATQGIAFAFFSSSY